MTVRRWPNSFSLLCPLIALLVDTVSPGSGLLAHPSAGTRALIQERGRPLPSGRVRGSAQVPLERAKGGDTPVLTFSTDRGPVRLLLDTGAASALMTPALVQRLGLETRPLSPDQFSLSGGGQTCGQSVLAKTRLPELRLGAGRIPSHTLRLQGLESFVLPVVALPEGIDGVLGAGTFQQIPVGIDPLSQQVFLGTPALQWREWMPGRPEVHPLGWHRGVPLGGIWLLSGSQGDRRPVPALIDTGAEGLFLTPELAAALRPVGRRESIRLLGVCGEQHVWRQRLMGIGMGPKTNAVQTHEGLITTNPVFTLLGVEAIVGQELLRYRRQLWRLDSHPPRLELW